MFGKSETEIMWITGVVDQELYDVPAESHGSIYKSSLSISEEGGSQILNFNFAAEPQSFLVKVLSAVMSLFVKGALQKVLQQDLDDIKAAVEAQ